VHIHFDDEAPPTRDLDLRHSAQMPKPVDEEAETTLTLTIPEAAELLGISLSKAYEAARLGQIPTIRLGSRILISRRRLGVMVDG
jgi:excisionase family DNA binding protein